jgi:hypothetical protein
VAGDLIVCDRDESRVLVSAPRHGLDLTVAGGGGDMDGVTDNMQGDHQQRQQRQEIERSDDCEVTSRYLATSPLPNCCCCYFSPPRYDLPGGCCVDS